MDPLSLIVLVLALVGGLMVAESGRPRRVTLAALRQRPDLAAQLVAAPEPALAQRLQRWLAKPELGLSAPAFGGLVLLAAGLAAAVALFFLQTPILAPALTAAAPAPLFLLAEGARRRQRERLADQLESFLQIVMGRLRAGYDLRKALVEFVETDPATGAPRARLDPPLGPALLTLVQELQTTNATLQEALERFGQRLGDPNGDLVVRALVAGQGGRLLPVLEPVRRFLRDQRQLQQATRAAFTLITAQAWILSVIPLAMLAMWRVATLGKPQNPLADPTLQGILVGVLLLSWAGIAVVHRQASLDHLLEGARLA